MHPVADLEAAPAIYAPLFLRVRAMVADTLLLVVVLLAITSVSNALPPAAGRWLNVAGLLSLLIYEPFLVSRFGSTLGHRMLNLRVVADAGGRISLPAAVFRAALKASLGVVSLLAVSLDSRHRAFHDSAVRCSVQVLDPHRARGGEFVPERTEVEPEGIPAHPLRRGVVTLGYLVMVYFLFGIGVVLAAPACMGAGACSADEHLVVELLGGGWLLGSVVVVVLGWHSRLVGARSRPVPAGAMRVEGEGNPPQPAEP